MLRYMLDTNLCIRVLRDRPAGLRDRFNREADALCISAIVLTELLVGAEKSNRPVETRREVDRFTARSACCRSTTLPWPMRPRYGRLWNGEVSPSPVMTL